MDNAGTFNRLIPLLSKSYYYIAVDLPGHGKSSHFPPHLPIHSTDYLLAYQLVINHFNRKKYILMGHSYGGQLGLLYAQMYPNRIDKLIMLDTLHLFPVPSRYFKNILEEKILLHLEIEQKSKIKRPPMYTFEEAIQKIRQGRSFPLRLEAAEELLKRALIPAGNGKYWLSFDQRLKNFINPLHDFRYALETLKKFPVHCPVLIILGKDSKGQQIFLKPFLDYYKKQSNFVVIIVPGDHDVHNNEPEEVASHIAQFLIGQSSSKL
ncbi:serine hydrolase-like protein 2 isoform X2 [Cylas formicarius]|nr:serine hydrolase-like protein 2 isoform X2 [Cylas formicarius]